MTTRHEPLKANVLADSLAKYIVPDSAKEKAEQSKANYVPSDYKTVEVVEPVYLRKLVEEIGSSTMAAQLIGCSKPTVGKGLQHNLIAMHYENAAMGIWLRDYEPKPKQEIADAILMADGDVFISMRIDKKAWDTIKPWLKEAGAKIKAF